MTTALQSGFCACSLCQQVSPLPPDGQMGRCPRCGAAVSGRKRDSLTRTWALLVAAAILYIPANLLPVMDTGNMFGVTHSTIIGGVIYFWNTGSAGLAILIFSVSVAVPLIKLGTLAYLAWQAGRQTTYPPPQQLSHLYRIVEMAGRWSMLDVFVIALMVGMVQFGSLGTVEAGPGAAAFGAVVVLSMLAAHNFDPRLLWDSHANSQNGS